MCSSDLLRENQLNEFLKNKEKLSDLSAQKDEEMINDLSKQIIRLGGKPNLENDDNKSLIKDLSKQLELLKFNSILKDNSKNTLPIDFLMMGELYQNNHHRRPNNMNFAVRWFEIDLGYLATSFLKKLKVIY